MAQRLEPGEALDDLLVPYLAVDRERGDRAWVLANMVAGLTGSTSVDGRVGALSTGEDARLFVSLRAVADVVLVGAETVRRERYGPVQLDAELVERRRDAGRAAAPRLALVSRSLIFDWTIPMFASSSSAARPMIITCAAASPAARAEASRHAEIVLAGDDQVDLGAAVAALAAAGLPVVLCEGGPQVLGGLVGLDLLDELCLSVAPLAGGDGLPVVTGPPLPLRAFRLRSSLLAEDGSLLLRYERDRSDARA